MTSLGNSFKPKILVVDDIEANLYVMEQMLEEVDADIYTAQSGEEGLMLLLEYDFAMVLLDVQMPIMDGFETARYIMTQPKTKNVPIIFVTAISKEEKNVLEGYHVGAVDYIFKPVEPKILLSKVNVFLSMYVQHKALDDSLKKREKSEKIIRTLLDAPQESAMLITTDGQVLAMNKIACNEFGIPSFKSGLNLYELLPPLLEKERRRQIDDAIGINRLLQVEETHNNVIHDIRIHPIVNDTNEVEYIAIFSRDITQQRVNEEHLVKLANYDILTGLPNRGLFNDYQNRLFSRAKRNSYIISVLFLDLDLFKEINDTLGHHTGDLLLKSVAERLKYCLRESDMVARMGGDEFAILLDNIDCPESAKKVSSKILNKLADPHVLEGKKVYCGVSIGIACYPSNGATVEQINKAADTAMYYAKKSGRNNFQCFSQNMQKDFTEHTTITHGLRSAEENDEFQLVYQPKIITSSKQIMGFEALLRWHSDELGLISPDRFIPITEENGQIISIGKWVMQQACWQVVDWISQGFDPNNLNIAVNVSARQFKEPDFVSMVTDVLEDTRLPSGMLEIEITEGVLMENINETVEVLNCLHERGIKISIDDFGTGYSSFSYLCKLPIDTIKIDRSFVLDIGKSKDSDAVITTIIALAHTLNMLVVAEGVETKEQVDFLSEKNCDYLQGFYFNKPLAVDHVKERLLTENTYNQ